MESFGFAIYRANMKASQLLTLSQEDALLRAMLSTKRYLIIRKPPKELEK